MLFDPRKVPVEVIHHRHHQSEVSIFLDGKECKNSKWHRSSAEDGFPYLSCEPQSDVVGAKSAIVSVAGQTVNVSKRIIAENIALRKKIELGNSALTRLRKLRTSSSSLSEREKRMALREERRLIDVGDKDITGIDLPTGFDDHFDTRIHRSQMDRHMRRIGDQIA